jgi:Ca2+-transporting ATPase
LTLLAGVLGIPTVSRLFAFETPSPALLAAGLAATGINLLWFEAVKWRLGRSSARPA